MSNYKLTTWANGFGIWYCRADFDFGVGNTPDAERLKYKALDAAKRAIRRELKLREGDKLGRLRYEIADNKLDSLNRLWSITVKERTEKTK